VAMRDMLNELRELDLNDLSLETIGSWPSVVKLLAWILVFAVVVGGGLHYQVMPVRQQLQQAEAREVQLKQEYERKAFQTANLEAYRQQMEEMEETFGALLRQLPTDTEVPGLLEDITDEAVNNGLEITRIQLQSEVAREYYMELPISIEVRGTYHDLAGFVSGVAGLPRIVTLHDFSISTGRGRDAQLSMSITARTYRYRAPGA
jgi:type IV pilus assembly protein PilO